MCVSDPESSPQIGQFVLITKGREAGKYAIVVKILDDRFVLIADGEKRKFHSPKKKTSIILNFLIAYLRKFRTVYWKLAV